MTLSTYTASRTRARQVAFTVAVAVAVALFGCEKTPPDIKTPPLAVGQDPDGAVAAVAELVFKTAPMAGYKEPFFLDVEGVDPSESLRRRIEGIDVRELSQAEDGDPRCVWIADVTATGRGAFEMSASYGSIHSQYCAKFADGRWRALRCGLTLAIH